MDIEVEIPYWGPQVTTFDPQRVLWRLSSSSALLPPSRRRRQRGKQGLLERS
jgi:hypothetical protein